MMTSKTSTQRAQALRKRRADAGLTEVRGIWALEKLHAQIKQDAARRVRRKSASANPKGEDDA